MRWTFWSAILCLLGCGSSADGRPIEIWRGNLAYEESVCDIVQSNPPLVGPAMTYRLRLGNKAGDEVKVVDQGGNVYIGTMTGPDGFEAYPADIVGDTDVPSAIIFTGLADGNAEVMVYFVLDAPHGCTHYYKGAFSRL